MCKRPVRMIHPTRSLLQLPLMSHVLPWQEDSGVWTKSLWTEFKSRGWLMRVVPKVMRGAFGTAFRLSFQEGRSSRSRQRGAWKLFMLAPRMLFTRPPRDGAVSRAKLVERCDAFRGMDVVGKGQQTLRKTTAIFRRRCREESGDELGRRAKRAPQLTQWGELSSARLALEGALVATRKLGHC